ncbi:hypothetical protein ACFOGI_06060 [Virgibacillus xinjiangensis]|uniref:Uncharacterized protein n=1 Tax=Virgibacillus xinjiangensis TaxID=393090 RepID=A0ABV7CU79_9BACI
MVDGLSAAHRGNRQEHQDIGRTPRKSAEARGYPPDTAEISRSARISAGHRGNQRKREDIRRTPRESAGARGYPPDTEEISRSARISAGHRGNRQERGDIRRTPRKSAEARGYPPDTAEIGRSAIHSHLRSCHSFIGSSCSLVKGICFMEMLLASFGFCRSS